MHEQFERAYLVIIDLVWKVQFAQELAQYFLVLLYTDICHFYIAELISSELTFEIVVKQCSDDIACKIDMDRLVYSMAGNVLSNRTVPRRSVACSVRLYHRTDCAF